MSRETHQTLELNIRTSKFKKLVQISHRAQNDLSWISGFQKFKSLLKELTMAKKR